MHHAMTLYITGAAPRSGRAVANIKKFCEAELPDRYSLRVVDLYEHPEQARAADVFVAPTLVRHEPKPERRLVGDLHDTDSLRAAIKVA